MTGGGEGPRRTGGPGRRRVCWVGCGALGQSLCVPAARLQQNAPALLAPTHPSRGAAGGGGLAGIAAAAALTLSSCEPDRRLRTRESRSHELSTPGGLWPPGGAHGGGGGRGVEAAGGRRPAGWVKGAVGGQGSGGGGLAAVGSSRARRASATPAAHGELKPAELLTRGAAGAAAWGHNRRAGARARARVAAQTCPPRPSAQPTPPWRLTQPVDLVGVQLQGQRRVQGGVWRRLVACKGGAPGAREARATVGGEGSIASPVWRQRPPLRWSLAQGARAVQHGFGVLWGGCAVHALPGAGAGPWARAAAPQRSAPGSVSASACAIARSEDVSGGGPRAASASRRWYSST
jgi:hypothetical protein